MQGQCRAARAAPSSCRRRCQCLGARWRAGRRGRTRWLVGSSSSSSVGAAKSARASATRMRQPPLMSFVHLAIIFRSKLRPASPVRPPAWHCSRRASARRPLAPEPTRGHPSARTPARAAAWPLSSQTSMDPAPPAARRFPGRAAPVSVTLAQSRSAPPAALRRHAASGNAASVRAARLALGAPSQRQPAG